MMLWTGCEIKSGQLAPTNANNGKSTRRRIRRRRIGDASEDVRETFRGYRLAEVVLHYAG